jgi:hypothetical protein
LCREVFDAEVLELFLALERRPDSYHSEDARRLARMLGLMDERLKVCFVNDVSRCSGYPPGHLTDIAFWKVRGVREALLTVCAQREDQPKAAAATENQRDYLLRRLEEAKDAFNRFPAR